MDDNTKSPNSKELKLLTKGKPYLKTKTLSNKSKLSNFYKKYDCFIISKLNKSIEKDKNKLIEYKRASKLFCNKKPKLENKTIYDINGVLIRRQSFQIQSNSVNKKVNNNKKIQLKASIKKKKKFIENNLKNNNKDTNKILITEKRKSYQNYKSEAKNRQNNTNIQSNIKSDLPNTKFSQKKKIFRKTYIPHHKTKNINNYENLFKDTDELFLKNEIKDKILKHNITEVSFEKNNLLFDDAINNNIININTKIKDNDIVKKEKQNPISKLNTSEHELDKFFKQNNENNKTNVVNNNNDNENKINNINENYNNNNFNSESSKNGSNNELFRFSNISKINNNDLYYLNNKNNLFETNNNSNNLNDKRNSIFITPKIEKIEGIESHELFDLEDHKLLEEMNSNKEKNKLENTIEQIVSVCTNCNKLINIDVMDEHSHICYNIKEKKIKEKKNNNENIIENKLKNILEYFNEQEENKSIENNFDNYLIETMKSNIEQIINIKEITQNSLEKLKKIDENINNLMDKYYDYNNIFTILSHTKISLEDKIKIFSEKIKKKIKNFENSGEETISDSDTTENFDLKKMEKILDENELKPENLDKFVNEAKNKRLFLMEVLKVKFQKIDGNKCEDLIPPEMIWEEACKQKIEMKNWKEFIFNELHNPNKYIKKKQKNI